MGKYKNTAISKKGTNFINKTTNFLLSYNHSFIEWRKRERLGRRVASEERISCGGYASSSWTRRVL